MGEDKPFSMVEVVMGTLVVGSLDGIEALLAPTGFGLILMPAEITVGMFVSLWFVYKGGSRMQARVATWIAGNALELAPFIDVLPTRTLIFLVAVYLANRDADNQTEKEGGEDENGGEETTEEEDQYEEESAPIQEEEYEDEDDEEYPLAA